MHFETLFFFSENDFFKPTHPTKVRKIPPFFYFFFETFPYRVKLRRSWVDSNLAIGQDRFVKFSNIIQKKLTSFSCLVKGGICDIKWFRPLPIIIASIFGIIIPSVIILFCYQYWTFVLTFAMISFLTGKVTILLRFT